jgi:predicted AAA+ superfamily ATPase
MFKRELAQQLLEATRYYPIITLTGPRQSGKTTLVRSVFKQYPYFNLEDPDVLEQIKIDPKKFLREQKGSLIIDEVQNYPELLSYLQVIVDENPQKGKYILTGSHQFTLLEAINQSLAGRTDILVLYPLSFAETNQFTEEIELAQWMLNGFYPRIYSEKIPAERNSKNYIKTYAERDVRKIINIKDIQAFQKFIKLCAGRIGQILNINNLCNETGVTHNTLKSWIGILEASHLIYLLQPYYENLGKRIIKSPKLYFVDVGLACYLLGIKSTEHLALHPLRGMLFENMVVMDLIKNQANKSQDPDVYFYRDNNQNEVDIIFERGGNLIPIEIKSSETFNKKFFKGIQYFMNLTKKAKAGYLIYAGNPIGGTEDVKILNFKDTKKITNT